MSPKFYFYFFWQITDKCKFKGSTGRYGQFECSIYIGSSAFGSTGNLHIYADQWRTVSSGYPSGNGDVLRLQVSAAPTDDPYT